MKRVLSIGAGLLLLGCQSTNQADKAAAPAATPTTPVAAATPKTFGEPVTATGAVPVAQLPQLLASRDSARVKLVGTAQEVCQAKGCWLTLALPENQTMRVRFRDYAFFVPKDLSGKTVVIEGWAHRREVPVAELQHYAKDAGKPAAEVAAITKPETQLSFMADGVLVP